VEFDLAISRLKSEAFLENIVRMFKSDLLKRIILWIQEKRRAVRMRRFEGRTS
jgi:hypothetical protein